MRYPNQAHSLPNAIAYLMRIHDVGAINRS